MDGLSYWILTNTRLKSERSNYFVYIKKKNITQLFTSTCERNVSKVLPLYFCIFSAVFTVCFGCPQMTPNAGLNLVFNKLCALWQPHWLCVLYWTFTANFTPPHALQYEISCRHIPCWWPAYQHQNTKYAGLAGYLLCWSMVFFPAGITAAYCSGKQPWQLWKWTEIVKLRTIQPTG